MALSFAAIFQPRKAERIAGAALLAWIVLATLTEQFAWAASEHGVLVAAAWLVPPVAGGAILPTAGHWWSGAWMLGGYVRRCGRDHIQRTFHVLRGRVVHALAKLSDQMPNRCLHLTRRSIGFDTSRSQRKRGPS